MSYNNTYNLSGINTTDPTQFYVDINSQLDKIPAIGLLIIVYVGVLSMYVQYGVARAHIAASAAVTGIGLILFIAGMLTPEILIVPISLLVLGLIALGIIDS